MIALRPLREDEYGAWDAAHRAEYERGLVEHVGMPRAQAQAKVERDVSYVLPDGLATADTHIWAVEDDGRVVGTVFVGSPRRRRLALRHHDRRAASAARATAARR